jgi:hypothetical protein
VKVLKGWRTLITNIFLAILTALIGYNWADVLPPEYAWFSGFIIAAANVGLRMITTTPVAQATPFPQPKAIPDVKAH